MDIGSELAIIIKNRTNIEKIILNCLLVLLFNGDFIRNVSIVSLATKLGFIRLILFIYSLLPSYSWFLDVLLLGCKCWFLSQNKWWQLVAGKDAYMWYGPQPSVCIHDPELIREASQNINLFHKPEANQFTRLLTPGLVSYNGDKWAKHRKLINPAFHGEKLKVFLLIRPGFLY